VSLSQDGLQHRHSRMLQGTAVQNKASRAARVQAKCRWRRAANNMARRETACKGSNHGRTDRGAGKGGKHARHQRARQAQCARLLPPFAPPIMTDPPSAKATPAMRALGATRQGDLATNMRCLKAATAAAALCSNALLPSTVKVLAHPDESEWVQSMEEEVQSCLWYKVWESLQAAGGEAGPTELVCC
jgi:hypothetical protein